MNKKLFGFVLSLLALLDLEKLNKNLKGFVDITVGITIGILFAGLMVIAYIIFEIRDMLYPDGAPNSNTSAAYNMSWRTGNNITSGFDNAVNMLIIVVIIWILALAIMALIILKKRSQ